MIHSVPAPEGMRWQEGVCPNAGSMCFCVGACQGSWVSIESEPVEEIIPEYTNVVPFPVEIDWVRNLANRADRLVRLLDLEAPEVLITKEKELVREALDKLEEEWE